MLYLVNKKTRKASDSLPTAKSSKTLPRQILGGFGHIRTWAFKFRDAGEEEAFCSPVFAPMLRRSPLPYDDSHPLFPRLNLSFHYNKFALWISRWVFCQSFRSISKPPMSATIWIKHSKKAIVASSKGCKNS